MIIDVRSLFTGGEALKVAIVMTVVATLSKWLAAWITQKIYRMQSNERSMIFGLSLSLIHISNSFSLLNNLVYIYSLFSKSIS